jgi:hypothetical protein
MNYSNENLAKISCPYCERKGLRLGKTYLEGNEINCSHCLAAISEKYVERQYAALC